MENVSPETRLKLYERIVQRYQEIISEKETVSVSELRHRISPYSDFVRNLRARLVHGLEPYDYQKHFFSGVERAIEYLKTIQNVELPFTFWFRFEDIDQIQAAPRMDKALLLTALLRSLESEQVKLYITRSKKPYVYFEWAGDRYLINPESGSLLRGEDVDKIFQEDPAAYAFSDLFFESYEE